MSAFKHDGSYYRHSYRDVSYQEYLEWKKARDRWRAQRDFQRSIVDEPKRPTVTVTPPVAQQDVTIIVDMATAQLLRSLVGHTAAKDRATNRRLFGLFDALRKAGVDPDPMARFPDVVVTLPTRVQ